MLNPDEMNEFQEVCLSLSPSNLEYVLAVANALKFAENIDKQNACATQKTQKANVSADRLFRGRRKDGKGWITGFYHKKMVKNEYGARVTDTIQENISSFELFDHEVESETISICCSGFKDTDGQLIFVGDVIEANLPENKADAYPEAFKEPRQLTVSYTQGCFCAYDKGKNHQYMLSEFTKVKVIGNIFENIPVKNIK